MRTLFNPRFWLALGLVVCGVVLRIGPHPWNFAPIGAIALFSGANFDRRAAALLVPLLTMFAGDTVLQLLGGHGYHSLAPVIYATYALIAVIGMSLRKRKSAFAVGLGALASATIFYVVTNFAVWMTSPMYTKDATGLLACYVAALPFFGNTLASDAIFSALFFGIFWWAERAFPLFSPSAASRR